MSNTDGSSSLRFSILTSLIFLMAVFPQLSAAQNGPTAKSPFQSQKVWLDSSLLQTTGGESWEKAWQTPDMVLSQAFSESDTDLDPVVPEQIELAALVDKECVSRQAPDPNKISHIVINADRAESDSEMRFEVYPLQLNQSMSLTELQREASNDECLIGLSQNSQMKLPWPDNSDFDKRKPSTPARPPMRSQPPRVSPRPPVSTPVGNSQRLQPNDEFLSQQKQLAAIRAQEGWSVFYDRASGVSRQKVVIAIVDSGIDYRHPDLRNVMWRNAKGKHGYNFIKRNDDPMDDHKHGTHVAGLAAAEMDNGVGVAGIMGDGAELMAVKVTDSGGGGSSITMSNGIRWAADNGADVINISLGGYGIQPMVEDALTYAVNKGATVFVAAGNENNHLTSSKWMSPANYAKQIRGVISIGSTDARYKKKSNFSNYSTEYVELAAPGSGGIYSTYMGGKYSNMAGTSMATPVAAGAGGLAIALMRAKGQRPSPAQVEDVMLRSGESVSGLQSYVKGGKHLDLLNLARTIEGRVTRGLD